MYIWSFAIDSMVGVYTYVSHLRNVLLHGWRVTILTLSIKRSFLQERCISTSFSGDLFTLYYLVSHYLDVQFSPKDSHSSCGCGLNPTIHTSIGADLIVTSFFLSARRCASSSSTTAVSILLMIRLFWELHDFEHLLPHY